MKIKTGLKAGECGEKLLRQYCNKCQSGAAAAAPAPAPPKPAGGGGGGGGGGNDPSWAQRGMDIGRSFSGGWW